MVLTRRMVRRRRSARRFVSRYRRRRNLMARNPARMIMRRALARRPHIPEVKWIDRNVQTYGIQTGSPQTWLTTNLSSLTIPQGVGINARVGNRCNLRKIYLKMDMEGIAQSVILASSQGPSNQLPDYFVRMVLWTPRVDYSRALNWFADATNNYYSIMDPNLITVVKDYYWHIAPQSNPTYNSTGTLNGYFQGTSAVPTYRHKEWVIPFPRSARFSNEPADITYFDVDKDILYVSFISNYFIASYPTALANWTARLTFTDA